MTNEEIPANENMVVLRKEDLDEILERGDGLPDGVRYSVFDAALASGVR
jgi:lysozyme family protein